MCDFNLKLLSAGAHDTAKCPVPGCEVNPGRLTNIKDHFRKMTLFTAQGAMGPGDSAYEMSTKKKKLHTDFARKSNLKEEALPDKIFLLTKSGPLDSMIAGKSKEKAPETETETEEQNKEITEQVEDEDSSSRFSQLSLDKEPQGSLSDSRLCACETSTHFCVRCGTRVCNFCSTPHEGQELRRIHRF